MPVALPRSFMTLGVHVSSLAALLRDSTPQAATTTESLVKLYVENVNAFRRLGTRMTTRNNTIWQTQLS